MIAMNALSAEPSAHALQKAHAKHIRLSVESDSCKSGKILSLQQSSFRENPTKFHPFMVR